MSYTKLTYHIVFSTKYRKNLIVPRLKPELYKYIGGIIKNKGGFQLEIGGIPDHIHILASLPPVISVSDMLRFIKSNSSKWVNEKHNYDNIFRWQTKYTAFTVSDSQISKVMTYIRNQEAHHRKKSFREELIQLFEHHGIEYDEKYLWD